MAQGGFCLVSQSRSKPETASPLIDERILVAGIESGVEKLLDGQEGISSVLLRHETTYER